MRTGLAIGNQGSSLPPRRFASTPFRRPATPAPRRRCGCLCFSLILCGLPLAAPHAQTETQTETQRQPRARAPGQPALGDSHAATTRAHHFLAQRASAQHLSPAAALIRAREQHLALQQQQRAYPHATDLTATWQPLGPSSILSPTYANLTGRITAIAPDPNDPTGNTVYLGTTGGGVWKSTNAAGPLASVTFVPLTDTLPVFSANSGSGVIPSLSIGAVAVQPGPDPVILAGTGDPNDATDSYYGEGLLRSADGGLTWTLLQDSHDGANGNHSFSGLATAALAFSTATPTLVVAAFSTSPQSAIVNATDPSSIPGLYYSTDAGQTWQMATLYDGTSVVQTPQPLGTGEVGNSVTAVVWDALRGQFFAAVRSHGYYASPDGITWTRLTAQPGTTLTIANCPVGANGLGSANCPIFRGALTTQPTTGDLYALTVDANDLDQGLWQDLCNATANTCSTSSPTFPNRIDQGALEVGGGSTEILQGSYDLALIAVPLASNGTDLFAGTIDLYACSLAPGATTCILRNTTNALNGCLTPAAVAPAQHTLATVAQSATAPILFLGNDGGLWRSLDGVAETGPVCSATDASHFDNLNPAIATGGSLAEIIGFAQDPTLNDTLLAGFGAIGSAATSTASALTAWPQLSPGEGGLPSIDPATPTNWYISIGAGINLSLCTLGANCTAANFIPPATVGEPQVSYDEALVNAPTLLDPADPTNLLAATCRVWRGAANDTPAWSTANALSPALDGSSTPCTETSPLIRSLGAGGPNTITSSSQTSGDPTSGSEVLYAGLAGALDGGGTIPGHLFVNTTANIAASPWLDQALSPVTNDVSDANLFNPASFDISSIAADPHDPTGATVYATVMGFGIPHLYSSTDFGAHWLNLSSNLPDAPAKAVAVDPNDANTVYIALDTGVYVTQAITSCPTTNCWSILGTALPNSPVIALATSPSIPTGDGRRGMIRAATYGRGIWQTPLLTAVSIAQPAITLSATSFTFPAQQVATQSASQTLTITSSGNAPVTFGAFNLTGDFAETDDCAGQTLAVNATCTVQIVFAPTATGTRSGQLTLYANISGGGQAIVLLSGIGTAPASILLDPLTLTFASTIVNQTTAAQNITISNTGGNSATLQTPIITGESTDFAITANTCTATLPASTGCTVSIAFTPTAAGQRSANLSITDSAGTQTASLTGTGQSPATDTLSPTALSFAQQTIGTISPAQNVTLTNTGSVALTLISASVSPGDFAVTNNCGNSLAANSTCAFSVTFAPTASGTRSATLTISDQFRSQTVSLSGIGIAPPGVSLSPASLTFLATGVGLATTPQTLTLTNNGGLPLTISSIAASPSFTIASNTCATTLAANAACTLAILFAPTAPGPFSGTLTFTDNASSTTQTAVLSGTGIDFTLAPNGSTSVTVASGTSATYPLLLSSLTGLSGNVALSCTGAPTNSTCEVVPAIAQLGGAYTISVTAETGIAPSASASTSPKSLASTQRPNAQPARPGKPQPSPLPLSGALFLGLLLPVVLSPRTRRRLPQLAASLALLLMLSTTLTSCGADRTIPNATITTVTPTPTPAGTYTLTVSATAAGLTHTVTLTLIVQ